MKFLHEILVGLDSSSFFPLNLLRRREKKPVDWEKGRRYLGACLFNINRTKSRNNNSVALRTLMNVNRFSVFNVNNTVVKIKTGDAGNPGFPWISFLYIKA